MKTLTIPHGIDRGLPIEGSPVVSKVKVITIFLEDIGGIGMKAILLSNGIAETKIYLDASWANNDILNYVENRQELYQNILNNKK